MNLECPMPKLEFEVITLSHGSGGVLTQKLLNQFVFELLGNEFLKKEDDGAIIEMNGKLAFSTDSFVISPIFFPGGDIGDLAVHGTVNDIAVTGANPKYLSLSFIIEEGLRMEDFWKILCSIKKACQNSGVQIITGDTKVVEKGKGDKIFINTTGIGQMLIQAELGIDKIKRGDDIIFTGPIASHGTTILTERNELGFTTSIKSDSAPLNKMIVSLLKKFGSDVHFMRDATRGGVAAVLNEVVKHLGQGIELMEKDIPIIEEVRDLCEILGLDPLYVANEGVVVIFSDPKISEDLIKELGQFEFGKKAKLCGKVGRIDTTKVILNSLIGGRRIVHMPLAEQLPRIC